MPLDDISKMNLIKGHNKSGWNKITELLVVDINKILDLNNETYIKINYVKEKYGHLDISYNSNNRTLFDKLFLDYEEIFETTCCVCGASGKLDESLEWIIPLCDDCKKESE